VAGSDFYDEFSAHLKQFTSAPVLFVGSGLSRRYLGLPDWNGLLEHLASYAPMELDYYSSSAGGDPGRIATLLAPALHEYLWAPAQKSIRTQYAGALTRPQSAIKVLTAKFLSETSNAAGRGAVEKEEIELFKKAVVDVAITTNYDGLLAEVLPDYRTYVGQDELVFADPAGVGEIYHVHGAVADPNSIVLTAEDFDEYNARNPYLIAKLLTMFAEHPVIFLGYSISDPNIIETLTKLAACLTRENIHKLQDRLIVVEWSKGSTASMTSTVIPVGGGLTIPVRSATIPDFRELFGVLGQVERRFNGRVLRQLKERVFELVRTNDPAGRLYVADLTNDKLAGNVDVVFGVGAIAAVRSYGPLSREELLRDLLHDDRNLDPERVVIESFPALLSRQGNFPMAKYLKGAGFLDDQGRLVNENKLPERVAARWEKGASPYLPSQSIRKQAKAAADAAGTFAAMRDTREVHETLAYFSMLPVASVRPTQLKKFLLDHEQAALDGDLPISNFAKAVCLLDRRLYGPTPAW
jgi:hypothetical protein